MLGEVGLLGGTKEQGDNGGVIGVVARFKLAFDLYVVCTDGVVLFEFSLLLAQRLVRRSFGVAVVDVLVGAGVVAVVVGVAFCFSNSRSRRFFSKRSSKFASDVLLLMLFVLNCPLDNLACENAAVIDSGVNSSLLLFC